MNKNKKNGWMTGLVVAVLLIGGLGAIGYMNKEAIVDRFPWLNGTPSSSEVSEIPSEETSEEPSEEVPVLVEQYQIILSKEQNFYISMNGPGLTGNPLDTFRGNIVSFTFTEETINFVFDPIDLEEDYYLAGLSIYAATGDNFGSWNPIIEDEPVAYGIYDFSAIVITEANQVLTPVYTPVYQ